MTRVVAFLAVALGPATLGLVALSLCGCWTQTVAIETRSVAPQVPPNARKGAARARGPALEGPAPPWPPSHLAPESDFRPSDTLRLTLTGGAIGLARQDLSVSVHGDGALLRLTLPVGARTGATGLAELTAWAISETPAPDANRASLRREIATIEGSLKVDVGAEHTSFEINVPRGRWRRALDLITTAISTTTPSTDQIERIRGRLLRTRRNELAVASIDNLITVLSELAVPPERYLVELEERTAEEVARFQESYYRTEASVLALWVPGTSAASLLDGAGDAVAEWAGAISAPAPERSAGETSPQTSVLWSATDEEICRFAFTLPLPHPGAPGALEKLVVLECLTMDGVGGRLEQAMTTPAALERKVRGIGARRYSVLSGHGTPGLAISTWQAHQRALLSLASGAPGRTEVEAATQRLRLRLITRYEDPRGWLDWATGRGSSAEDTDELTTILAKLDQGGLDLLPAIAEVAEEPSPLVAIGGRPPAEAEVAVAPAPSFADPAGDETPIETTLQIEAADEYLKLAMRALGGRAKLRQARGISAELERHTDDGMHIRETVWFSNPGHMRRLRRVFATTIETVVTPRQPYERSGDRKIRLDQEETQLLLDRMKRHPVMLLAEYARGNVRFRLISTRRIGDREMAVLERIDATERLRILLDSESGLVRVVETRERRIDLGERIHITERYDDYRPVSGVRMPFRRITTVDDGEAEVITTWNRIMVGAPSPRFLAGDGPASLPPK